MHEVSEEEFTKGMVDLLESAEALPIDEKVEALRKAMLLRAKRERQSFESEWDYVGASSEMKKA